MNSCFGGVLAELANGVFGVDWIMHYFWGMDEAAICFRFSMQEVMIVNTNLRQIILL